MPMFTNAAEPRFQHFIYQDGKVIVMRIIGAMAHADVVERLFAVYDAIPEPWTWQRIIDLRRIEGVLTFADIEDEARRWAQYTEGRTYRSKYAVVSTDPLEKARVPAAIPLFPNEIVCHFSDYHEALKWVQEPY